MDYFDCKYLTLIGYVQSGKTNEEISYCYNSIKHKKLPVLFLTRNITADQLQLRDRFSLFDFDFDIKILSHIKNDDAVNVLNDCGVLILLCNPYQLKRINTILTMYGKQFNLCIDEVDFSIKSPGENNLLNGIKNKATHILGATATPFAVFSHEKSLTMVKKIKPNQYYHGIETLNVNFVEPCIIHKEYDFPLCDMAAMDEIYESILEKDHAVILHTVVKEKMLHTKIQKYLSNTYKSLTVVTYNGDGIKVVCNNRISKVPFAKKKALNNYNQLINLYSMKKEYDDSITHHFTNYSISEVLQILSDDLEYDHTHISIVSGHLASRGISFVSTDYKVHLTDQYFHTHKKSHGENLLQSLRILGCYKDNTPLTLWCNKDIWKSIKTQNQIINNLVNGVNNSREWMFKIQKIIIPRPNNPLTRRKLCKYFVSKEKNTNDFLINFPESESELESESEIEI